MAAKAESRQSTAVHNRNHGTADGSKKHPKPAPKALMLSPSPILVEPIRSSKDDSHVSPATPKRPNLQRGLSLQLPKQDVTSPSAFKLTHSHTTQVPLSPKLDPSASYGTNIGSVLPRRSRGYDFSRACTNLHHSMLAEQSSPDSSPVIGGKAVNIPRKAVGPDSPMHGSSSWSTGATSEKQPVSSSLGSVNMIDSGSDTSSDEDMFQDEEEPIHMTPKPSKVFAAFSQSMAPSPGVDPMAFSPTANLMSFKRRSRSMRAQRAIRKGSSSTSLQSSVPSPGPLSPPLRSENSGASGYFSKSADSRRESLSLGTNELRISDATDGDFSAGRGSYDALGLSTPRVVQRAVTRRSDMKPKPKTFARIRAALQEESSPVDSECRREAEVIKQVREGDPSPDSNTGHSASVTAASSPAQVEAIEELTDIMGKESSEERRPSVNFSQQALRNSIGQEFWNTFDERMRTPPPPFPLRANSSISDDIAMETPTSTTLPNVPLFPSETLNSSPSRSSTPQPPPLVTTGELTRKALGKRRRDDDFDPTLIKRRAVSPGLSLQNSPILPPSPAQREGGWWQTKAHRESSASSTSNSISSGAVGKRIGMQGMNDTNDGLMNMSIE